MPSTQPNTYVTHTNASSAHASGTPLPGGDNAAVRKDAANALARLSDISNSLSEMAPSPPAVGRFTALMHHVGNAALSISALGVASLNTVKETYECSTLSSAHKISLSTAAVASLSSVMDLAVAVGKYCNPESTTSQIMNTAWFASAGKLLGSKHIETYGGKYQTALLGASMMLFFNRAGQIAGEHDAQHEHDDAVTPNSLGLPALSSAPQTLAQEIDALQSCIGFAATAYRAFGNIATTAVIDWMSAREAKRNMDVVERQLNYEDPFGTEGKFRLRDADAA
ncbi:hypothetical protein PAN31117_01108 [Pandoraea anapnoica]|uniref:Uncharacterized protein n=1 Tax=Pandoraea anapnoica TaxID=2508301 RepID=A0A5E4ZQG3_9BURK|nr:hypothetical protein [Pandoraea anapnoica]VVE62977.1 hypothetical protein PAN31117_01108 [Pandoraea anapnoica]